MNFVNGGGNSKKRIMSESKEELLNTKPELEECLGNKNIYISGKLKADFAEQATQLDNRDVLLAHLHVSEEELQSTKSKLAALS